MKRKSRILFSGIMVMSFILLAFGSDDDKESSKGGITSVEGTKNCLTGYDWIRNSGSTLESAWKFSSDGTFSYSTTLFGGMSTWGNWSVNDPGKIKLKYTRSSTGEMPADKVISMNSCSSFSVGSTLYVKD
jgi:hypothetical protein